MVDQYSKLYNTHKFGISNTGDVFTVTVHCISLRVMTFHYLWSRPMSSHHLHTFLSTFYCFLFSFLRFFPFFFFSPLVWWDLNAFKMNLLSVWGNSHINHDSWNWRFHSITNNNFGDSTNPNGWYTSYVMMASKMSSTLRTRSKINYPLYGNQAHQIKPAKYFHLPPVPVWWLYLFPYFVHI